MRTLFSVGIIVVFGIASSVASYFLNYPNYYNWIPAGILGWFSTDIYDYLFKAKNGEKHSDVKRPLDSRRTRIK